MEKVDSILKKSEMPDRHTFFQIEKFLIGKEPTGQAQLWQIVRELEARKETIENYKKQLEDAEDELELFDIRIERLDRKIRKFANAEEGNNDLIIRECEINIRRLQRDKECLIKSAKKVQKKSKNLMEEMSYLVHGYEKLIKVVGEMKPMDDEQAQREYWNEKLLEEFNLRTIFNRGIDPEFAKTVLAIDADLPVKQHMERLVKHIQLRMLEQGKEPKRLAEPKVEALAKAKG